MKKTAQNLRYFAAANTYKGFISYFKDVFDSKKYDRIYVLKGGPGTGKSTLMKRISSNVSARGGEVTEILCSSDPNSLDGIVASSQDKKIAILDGTAPHERDAVIPGAIDEIIDLGSFWDKRWLVTSRKEILSISEEKRNAYFTAYSYLSLSGKIDEFIYSLYTENFVISKAKNKAESILPSNLADSQGIAKDRLVSSFSKQGYYKIDTFSSICNANVKVGGEEYSGHLFMSVLVDLLRYKNVDFIRLPFALSPDRTEGVYLPTSGLLIKCDAGNDLNADEFIIQNQLIDERLRCAKFEKDTLLKESKRWFAIASDLHFRLEDIYSKSMQFDIMDDIIADKTAEILQILEL